MSLFPKEQKVDVSYVAIGMFVCRLDRDWLGTPFPIEGFHIESLQQVEWLRRSCDFVVIDLNRSHLSFLISEFHEHPPEKHLRIREYADTASLPDELPRAREAYDNAATLASRIIEDVRSGNKLSMDHVKHAVEPVVQSVLRNADAFMWISRLRKQGAYEYSHAINCSLLAAAFGRHMGFDEKVLVSLASGGLLLDVGKSEVPRELLTRAGPLAPDELAQVRLHVEHGLAVLEKSGIRHINILEMIRTHHERHDGSGYPSGLGRNQIPLFGRIAAVIDSYDAMTSDRAFTKAMAPHQALQLIYRQRDLLYQGEVVEQFMQCLSVYPTGSLVELNTGEVAIVMAQNQARRLRPRVMLLTTPDKTLQSQFIEIDLLAQGRTEGTIEIEIVATLSPGAYGIDPTELYLN